MLGDNDCLNAALAKICLVDKCHFGVGPILCYVLDEPIDIVARPTRLDYLLAARIAALAPTSHLPVRW